MTKLEHRILEELVDSPRIQAAIEEIKAIILERHLDALFDITFGEDPCGIYLKAIVDIDDTDEVADLCTDRLVDLQVEEELPIYVVPLPTAERIAEAYRTRKNWSALART